MPLGQRSVAFENMSLGLCSDSGFRHTPQRVRTGTIMRRTRLPRLSARYSFDGTGARKGSGLLQRCQSCPWAQGQCGLRSSGHRLSICSRINAAWRIAFSTAATLAGLGLSGSSSISLRAHSNVAAKRIANFRSSVMGISRVEFAGSGRGFYYTPPRRTRRNRQLACRRSTPRAKVRASPKELLGNARPLFQDDGLHHVSHPPQHRHVGAFLHAFWGGLAAAFAVLCCAEPRVSSHAALSFSGTTEVGPHREYKC